MKPTRLQSFLAIAGVSAAVLVGQSSAAKHPANAPHHVPSEAPRTASQDIMRTGAELDAKIVQYSDRDIVRVKTKLRYTTLIILPKDEQILDFTCGDKEYLVVNGNQNFAYVKPAKPSAETNLNLVTASGNVYSFVLEEVSATSDTAPDLKVFVELKDSSMLAATAGRPRFVSADVADSFRQQVEGAKEETRQVKQATQAAIDSGVGRFISNVRFAYRFEAGRRPFFVRAMYHDDKFTYIQARPEETPTLYEFQDGTPNLINFKYENGSYVVDKILNRGYLAIGKQKLGFTREE
jgi:type IV secretion system protein VirB9